MLLRSPLLALPLLLLTALLGACSTPQQASTSNAPVQRASSPAVEQAPSFDCTRVAANSIGAMVCGDAELARLDRQLSTVYGKALTMATDFLQVSPRLRAEQRGWIRGRDDCWKATDVRACVEQAYVMRIAELQATYRLVSRRGPVFYACEGDPANEVVATFFATTPPTAVVERGDQVSVMYLQRSASGARYEGGNDMLWEHQGEATVRWGFEAVEMTCVVKQTP